MAKIGIVGIKDAWSTEVLVKEVSQRAQETVLIEMDKVYYDSHSRSIFYEGMDLAELDAIIIKKITPIYSPEHLNRLELLSILEKKGVKIFSSPTAVIRAINRLSNTLTLQNGDIAMPDTIVTENIGQAIDTITEFGTAIIKPLFSSKARGMEVVKADDENLHRKLEMFQQNINKVMYIQKMVDIPGRDLGLVFVGGEYVGTYARVKHDDSWNTTTASGGYYEHYSPNVEVISLAKRAQGLFDLDFTCVDIVETANGPQVFEVSAFGGFKGLHEANNINAAALYAGYVIEHL